MKNIPALLLLLLWTSTLQAQKTKKVLFLGNSYTYVNDLPGAITGLAASKGNTLDQDQNLIGGYTFNNHRNNATSRAKIKAKKWDYVVLQEQSQIPSFPDSQVETDCFQYCDTLTRLIRENDTCTKPLYYMTWGRKNGDAMNCASWPPVCTYAGMQARLRKSYLEMAARYGGTAAPVGACWSYARAHYPSIELYDGDESHPSPAGTYLAACTLYNIIFEDTCKGTSYLGGLPGATAKILQAIADSIVYDSLATWRFDTTHVRSGFTKLNTGGNSWAFTNKAQNAILYEWKFGDGATSTATNPTHTYTTTGKFYITLKAIRKCETPVYKDSVTITTIPVPTGIEPQFTGTLSLYPQPAHDELTVQWSGTAPQMLSLYDLSGRLIIRQEPAKNSTHSVLNTAELSPGIYLLQCTTNTGTIRQRILKE